MAAGENGAGGQTEGDDEEAPLGAEGEIVGRRLVSLRKSLVGDRYDFSPFFLCFRPYSFFCRRDKGRNQHPSVGAGVQPSLPIGLLFLNSIGPMHDYLLFERIVQEMKIAIGRKRVTGDVYLVHSGEEIRTSKADCETVGVVAKVVKNDVEFSGGGQYLVIEAFLKHAFDIGSFIDHHLESGEFTAENLVKSGFHRKKKVEMIGH